jgi:hypothetical protein
MPRCRRAVAAAQPAFRDPPVIQRTLVKGGSRLSCYGYGQGSKSVTERTVVSIVWRQIAPNEIELAYRNGEVERIQGTHADAARLAADADMLFVSSPLGMVRWTRDLPPRARRSPKRIGPWLSN